MYRSEQNFLPSSYQYQHLCQQSSICQELYKICWETEVVFYSVIIRNHVEQIISHVYHSCTVYNLD